MSEKKQEEEPTFGFKIFPWEKGAKPYFVNKENGIQWYIDPDLQGWAELKKVTGVHCFILRNKDGEAFDRVIMLDKTNEVFWNGTGLEAGSVQIDLLAMMNHFKDQK